MKPHDSACTMMDTVHLPAAVLAYLEANKYDANSDDYIKGGVLESSQHAWLASSSKLTVINTTNGQQIAAWTFGAALRDLKPRITCVTELPNPLIEQTMQLLIGLDCELIGGMVCLFHCNGSRILRAVQVDCQVVCMQYIEDLRGSALECFDGAVLIGTSSGGAFIFDLNRYICTEGILNTDNQINVRDEFNIANLVVLSIDDINIIGEQRKIASKKDHHIAIKINEGCIHNLQFILYNQNKKIMFRTERENIFVTSILYVPQLTGIIIGFNIGVFQLWNLLTLELEYTSQLTDQQLPITHLGFMEPCDDPRAFCYIWAIYSTTNRHDTGFPLAAMYSLSYHDKQNIDEQRYIYKNFHSCHLRFSIELSNLDGLNNAGKQLIGGRSLVCHTLSKTANKEDADEYVLNLCQIVWECWTTSAIAPVQSVMILFDIDQWYKDHMPDSSLLQTNNFMCVVNLGDTFASTSNSYLCDVKIDADSLTSYCSVQRLEEHFYPNSIGYECLCLTNSAITKLLTMGVQRQLLASINKIGPAILLNPTKLFNQCIATGLIPPYVDPPPNTNTPEHIQRQILLSVALEARLIQFLGKCACDWATGSHSSTGCTLQLILEWSWTRAVSLKQNGDIITTPFFDLSSGIPDRNSVLYLNNCVRQLGHIGTLYNIIIDKCSTYLIAKNLADIKQRQKIIQMIAQYFQVIQWFLNVGLLPEYRVDQMTAISSDKLPYPIESLNKFYQNRRLKLHCLSGENPANEELRNKACKLLFIDELMSEECCENKLKALWIEDESTINGLYPPPSLHSLLKVYLIPEIKEEYKHSLVLYMLIDYAMMFDDERYENVIRRLMQFPTMFGLSNTAIKVTQAFWHLDHRDFELALNQLQWVLTGGCLTQWQHNVVLSALLIQKKTQSALQYLHVRKPCISVTKDLGDNSTIVFDDWETCSNIYLSRGLVYEAFNLYRDSLKDSPTSVCKERLEIFFECCQKMSLLTKVLLLPLTQLEESILVKFLKSMNDSQSNDLLVLYYLKRSRYIEAQQTNEELKRLTSKGQLPYEVTNDFLMRKEHVHKTETRDQLVDLYYKSLPPITRQLAHFATSNSFGRKCVFPTPLTVSVQTNSGKSALYKSSFIQATIEKASEIWLNKPAVQKGIKRSFQIEDTPFLCTPKLNKSSSRLIFDEKMSTTPEETPSKRRKLNTEDNESEDAISPKLREEIETLLHTPVIERKSNWSIAGSIAGSYDRQSMTREATPRSILKIRHLKNRAISSPLEERFLAETDDETDRQSDLSRSIRFNIPSGDNSPTSECASDVQDSFNELCNYNTKRTETISADKREFTPSPRRSIHQSFQISKSFDEESLCVEIVEEPDDHSIIPEDTYVETSQLITDSPKSRRSYTLSNTTRENTSSNTISTNQFTTEESNRSIQKSITKLIRSRISIALENSDVISKESFRYLNRNESTTDFTNESLLPSDTSDKMISDTSLNIPQIEVEPENDELPEIDTDEVPSSLAVNAIDDMLNDQMETENISDESNQDKLYIDINDCEEIVVEDNIGQNVDDVHEDNIVDNDPENLENAIVEEIVVDEIVNNTETDNDDAEISFQSILNNAEIDIDGTICDTDENVKEDIAEEAEIIESESEIGEDDVEHDESEHEDTGENVADETEDEVVEEYIVSDAELVEEDIVNDDHEIVEKHIVNDGEFFEENIQNDNQIQELSSSSSEDIEKINDNPSLIIDENSTSDNDSQIVLSIEESINEDKNTTFNSCETASVRESDQLLSEKDATVEVSLKNEVNPNIENVDSIPTEVETLQNEDSKPAEVKIIEESNVIEKMEVEESTPAISIENNTTFSVIVKSENVKCEIIDDVPLVEKNTPQSVITSEKLEAREIKIDSEDVVSVPVKIENIVKSEFSSPVKNTQKIEKTDMDMTSELSNSSTLTSSKRSKKSKSDIPSNVSEEGDSRLSTPRHFTRSSSKLDSSIQSDSSVDSDRESPSVLRKSRRSIIAMGKPNLSVIPEISHTEDEKSHRIDNSSRNISVLEELSSRRMTRHQRSLLEKSLELSRTIPTIREETSENSLRIDEEPEGDTSDQESVSGCSSVTAKTMDPILLLDKQTFDGPPDLEEAVNLNSSRASSIVSDVLDATTPVRLKRAASEPRTVKRLKDMESLGSPKRELRSSKKSDMVSLNESITDSPGRPRRQSFNKAVEALSTPRRSRRISTDSKASDSGASLLANVSEQTESVAETTVIKRLRRPKAASIHGHAVISNLDEAETRVLHKRARKSLISTPLSKEELVGLTGEKVSHYRKKIGTHRVSRPLQFAVTKK